ncbi:MAG: hypothetical protein NTY08_14270 [Proteobacteria bacterium]|nr:hypothetical protein [Pseudomonadota bacterium]
MQNVLSIKLKRIWIITAVAGVMLLASGCSTTGGGGAMGGFSNTRGSCFVAASGTPWCR